MPGKTAPATYLITGGSNEIPQLLPRTLSGAGRFLASSCRSLVSSLRVSMVDGIRILSGINEQLRRSLGR